MIIASRDLLPESATEDSYVMLTVSIKQTLLIETVVNSGLVLISSAGDLYFRYTIYVQVNYMYCAGHIMTSSQEMLN